jgi:nucleoside-diphosphate-sugar epimerase
MKITGVSGFVATHVVAKALEAGYSIRGRVLIVYPAVRPKR